jgi:hypothetical protein
MSWYCSIICTWKWNMSRDGGSGGWFLYWGGMWLDRFGVFHMMFWDGLHVFWTVLVDPHDVLEGRFMWIVLFLENHMTFLKGGSCERTLICYFTWQIWKWFHVRWWFGMKSHDLEIKSVMWMSWNAELHTIGALKWSCERAEMTCFTW